MDIRSKRKLKKQTEVLKNPKATGPDPVYAVFDKLGMDGWENETVLVNGSYDGEFPKTYGHYHPEHAPPEKYELVSGQGVFLLQKKFYDENGKWIPEKVREVLLVKAEKPGTQIVVNPDYGHSWSNVGNEPLVTLDDWTYKHTPGDYIHIERLRGMAYYLVEKNGEVEAIPNSNYKDLPKPKWITSEDLLQPKQKF
jgi:oxalate decarboxylase/phosphoglucose isomerase-like protein (cupin superfamily)